jgi:hypothetical protein
MSIYENPIYLKHRAAGKCVEDAIVDTQSEFIDLLSGALKAVRASVLDQNFFAVGCAFEEGGYAQVALAKVQS